MSSDSFARGAAIAIVLIAGALLASALFIQPVRATEPAVKEHAEVDAVLERLTKSYSGVSTIEASFVQTSTGMSYGSPLVQKGSLAMKRPGSMRWDFVEPTRQQYISDGSTFWWVDEAARTCTVYRQVDGTVGHFFDLLTGMSAVKKDFDVSLAAAADRRPDSDSLKLVPKEDTSGLGTVLVHVSTTTGLVTGVTNVTPFGDRTEVTLSEVRTDREFPDSHFVWTPREGYREIEGG